MTERRLHWLRQIRLALLAWRGDADRLARALTSPDDDERLAAGHAVLRRGARSAEPLLNALGHGDPELMQRGCKALAALRDPRTAGAVAPLLVHIREATRLAAVTVLGELGGTDAPLITALDDPTPPVRVAAALALARRGFEPAVPLLIEWLHWTSDGLAAGSAAALGAAHDPRAAEPLVALLNQPHEPLRLAAAAALGELGSPLAIGPLVELLASPDRQVRETAVESLGRLRGPQVGPALLAMLPDRTIRPAVVRALTVLGEGPLAIPLGRALDGDPDAFEYFRDRRAVPVVLEAVRRSDPGMVARLTEALVQFGPGAVEPLLHGLDSPDDKVRGVCITVLGKLHAPSATLAIVAALDDAYQPVRLAAVEAVGRLRDPRGVEPLTHVLQDHSSHVRQAVVRALVAIGDSACVPSLLTATADADRVVAATVAEALGRLGDRRAVPTLIEQLRTSYPEVRWAAATALGELRDERALGPLTDALDPWSLHPLGAAAATALGRFGSAAGSALPLLRELAGRGGTGAAAFRNAVAEIEAALRGEPSELLAADPVEGSGTELEAGRSEGDA